MHAFSGPDDTTRRADQSKEGIIMKAAGVLNDPAAI
jgi:hypothetical protein